METIFGLRCWIESLKLDIYSYEVELELAEKCKDLKRILYLTDKLRDLQWSLEEAIESERRF